MAAFEKLKETQKEPTEINQIDKAPIAIKDLLAELRQLLATLS